MRTRAQKFEDFMLDRVFPVFLWVVLLASVIAAVLFAVFLTRDVVRAYSAAQPVDLPHVASDCRAACTLEGMEFAGAEISPAGQGNAVTGVRCLCAPSGAGGDL